MGSGIDFCNSGLAGVLLQLFLTNLDAPLGAPLGEGAKLYVCTECDRLSKFQAPVRSRSGEPQ